MIVKIMKITEDITDGQGKCNKIIYFGKIMPCGMQYALSK
jgi:hypothetical protein